ncbi:MAG: hypothetical protein AB8H03_12985 [Saprospiraceae bacterium]
MDSRDKIIQSRLFEIQDLIAMDEVSNAIKLSLDFVREFSEDHEKLHMVVLLSSQFNYNKNQMNLGLIKYEDVYLKRNQILTGILGLVQQVHDFSNHQNSKS